MRSILAQHCIQHTWTVMDTDGLKRTRIRLRAWFHRLERVRVSDGSLRNEQSKQRARHAAALLAALRNSSSDRDAARNDPQTPTNKEASASCFPACPPMGFACTCCCACVVVVFVVVFVMLCACWFSECAFASVKQPVSENRTQSQESLCCPQMAMDTR